MLTLMGEHVREPPQGRGVVFVSLYMYLISGWGVFVSCVSELMCLMFRESSCIECVLNEFVRCPLFPKVVQDL